MFFYYFFFFNNTFSYFILLRTVGGSYVDPTDARVADGAGDVGHCVHASHEHAFFVGADRHVFDFGH